jgi:hypothetical protein
MAEGDTCFSGFWCNLKGTDKTGNSLIKLTKVFKSVAEIVMRLNIIRFDEKSFVVKYYSLVKLSKLLKGKS